MQVPETQASSHLTLRRAEGVASSSTDVDEPSGRAVKVYDRDSRDADLLYRGYRTALYRGPNEQFTSGSLDRDVEHEALMFPVPDEGRKPAPEVMTKPRTARSLAGGGHWPGDGLLDVE